MSAPVDPVQVDHVQIDGTAVTVFAPGAALFAFDLEQVVAQLQCTDHAADTPDLPEDFLRDPVGVFVTHYVGRVSWSWWSA